MPGAEIRLRRIVMITITQFKPLLNIQWYSIEEFLVGDDHELGGSSEAVQRMHV